MIVGIIISAIAVGIYLLGRHNHDYNIHRVIYL